MPSSCCEMSPKYSLITLLLFLLQHPFAQLSSESCSWSLTRHFYDSLLLHGFKGGDISEVIVLSRNPIVKLFRNCISKQQRFNLMQLAKKRLTEDTASGFSSSLYLQNKRDANLSVLREIAILAGDLSGLPWKFAEPVSLTKYSSHQKYELHYDSGFSMIGKKMKRDATFLVYLNSVSHGGETIFPCSVKNSVVDFPCMPNDKPLLKDICHQEDVLRVSPEARSCLVFFNHFTEEQGGELNPRSIHGSCPVINEEKWIVQIWLHREPWGSGVTDFW
ncbi:uncharacterized protein [Montipora capricornis]|uniref:uncharacterized protein n=1 Tax=Montipora capricornis TaxID=246305 RepID=UPI0035F18841